jgi:hypothetical protein
MSDITGLRAARDAFLAAKHTLAEEVARSRRGGVPAEVIAAEISLPLSRDQLLAYIEQCAVYEAAGQVLAASWLRDTVVLSAPGVPSQEGAQLALVTIDPNEYQDYDLIPRDVGEVLGEDGISLVPTQAQDAAGLDAETALLHGEFVRLVQDVRTG